MVSLAVVKARFYACRMRNTYTLKHEYVQPNKSGAERSSGTPETFGKPLIAKIQPDRVGPALKNRNWFFVFGRDFFFTPYIYNELQGSQNPLRFPRRFETVKKNFSTPSSRFLTQRSTRRKKFFACLTFFPTLIIFHPANDEAQEKSRPCLQIFLVLKDSSPIP